MTVYLAALLTIAFCAALAAAGRRSMPDAQLPVPSCPPGYMVSIAMILTLVAGLRWRVAMPHRLQTQVDYLREHPEVDLVGTTMRRFNERGEGDVVLPTTVHPDRWTMMRTTRSPLLHATVMARRTLFQQVGNYTGTRYTVRVEDVDLWYKFFAARLGGRNSQEPLHLYREDSAALRRRNVRARISGYVTRIRGNRNLGYPLRAHIVCTTNLMKILVPYRVFDWHRRRQQRLVMTGIQEQDEHNQ